MRRLALIVLAAASFGLTAGLVSRAAPRPEMGVLSAKLDHFARHGGRYDVVFFGSSRVYRGVVPERFDAEMAARGFPLRSFNLGVNGMGPHEAGALIRRVLAKRPARLRWVVLELGSWDAGLPAENRFKGRALFWHDPAETRSVLRSTLLLDTPAATRAGLLWTHLLHLAARQTGAGRGPDLARALLRSEPAAAPDFAGQGFAPFPDSFYGTPSPHAMRRAFLDDPAAYEEAVRRPRHAPARASLDGYNLDALERQSALIRSAGAEPVYLVPPTPRPFPELALLRARGGLPTLLAFDDPAAWPELFRRDRRFDAEHLTTAGAHLFSALLAERFAESLSPAEEAL